MKPYKRNISTLVGTALLILIVVACEKNEPTVHELVGTWVSTSGKIYYGASVASADSSVADPYYNFMITTFVFKEDNTGSISATDGSWTQTNEFTWSTSGSDLVVLEEEDGTSTLFTVIYDITGNTLTITEYSAAIFDIPERWHVVKYQKQ